MSARALAVAALLLLLPACVAGPPRDGDATPGDGANGGARAPTEPNTTAAPSVADQSAAMRRSGCIEVFIEGRTTVEKARQWVPAEFGFPSGTEQSPVYGALHSVCLKATLPGALEVSDMEDVTLYIVVAPPTEMEPPDSARGYFVVAAWVSDPVVEDFYRASGLPAKSGSARLTTSMEQNFVYQIEGGLLTDDRQQDWTFETTRDQDRLAETRTERYFFVAHQNVSYYDRSAEGLGPLRSYSGTVSTTPGSTLASMLPAGDGQPIISNSYQNVSSEFRFHRQDNP